MYTEPKIITTDDLKVRAYILFYYNGKRCREYNGKTIGVPISPNRASSVSERNKLLRKLTYEIQKALEGGWNPTGENASEKEIIRTTQCLLNEVLKDKVDSSLSTTYKRDLQSVHKQFIEFLTSKEANDPISNISLKRLDEFLKQFDTTGTHYMNKRRALGVLFSSIVRKGYITSNPLEKTLKRKAKATLHQIYTPEKVKEILKFLKPRYPNLHLCCLLTYGCLLRPHHESRLLTRSNFNEDLTEIRLSGNENKSGRVRTVHIPEYVREELLNRGINLLKSNENIISCNEKAFNVSYFSLQWSRAKKQMIEESLLEKDQTIYSFRHSAALNIYNRTKDIYILQQLLGHSNMIVTLKYLRGLGELNKSQLQEFMPSL